MLFPGVKYQFILITSTWNYRSNYHTNLLITCRLTTNEFALSGDWSLKGFVVCLFSQSAAFSLLLAADQTKCYGFTRWRASISHNIYGYECCFKLSLCFSNIYYPPYQIILKLCYLTNVADCQGNFEDALQFAIGMCASVLYRRKW